MESGLGLPGVAKGVCTCGYEACIRGQEGVRTWPRVCIHMANRVCTGGWPGW